MPTSRAICLQWKVKDHLGLGMKINEMTFPLVVSFVWLIVSSEFLSIDYHNGCITMVTGHGESNRPKAMWLIASSIAPIMRFLKTCIT